MSDTAEEPRPEQGNVNPTQRVTVDIDWSQFYDMFMNIEQRLPNFDHMLMAMNDYAYQRTSRQRQTNDLSEFCGVLKKGFFDWYTSSVNNEINRVPNFIDLTNQVFDDDKKLVSSTSSNADTSKSTITSPNTDDCKSIQTSSSTDANESTNTNSNADTIKSTGTSPNIDACKSTHTSANTDASEIINTGANTDESESTNINSNTDASKTTNINTNADASKSSNTSINADASKSTSKSANTCSHKSVNTCTHKSVKTCSHTSAPAFGTYSYTSSPAYGTCTNKRARTSMNTYSAMVENTKHFYRHVESKSTLGTLLQSAKQLKEQSAEQSTEPSVKQSAEQSTEPSVKQSAEQSVENSTEQSTSTNVVTDPNFKILMPSMTEEDICLRKRLPIDRNIHLGNEYERHWWRQTNDKIILNVDVSDLVVNSVPNIKVVVTIIGFKIKTKRLNKWIVILSNKFEKPISKSKWVVNKFMHVKLTIDKREKEFWSKCLVTETRKLDTSVFENHSCSSECSAPILSRIKLSATKKECLSTLTTFLRKEYGMEDVGLITEGTNNSTVTNPPATEEKPQESAVTLELSADPSTVKSLNSDSENPTNTNPTILDSEVPTNLAASCNPEVSQNQSDFKSVKSSSHP